MLSHVHAQHVLVDLLCVANIYVHYIKYIDRIQLDSLLTCIRGGHMTCIHVQWVDYCYICIAG